MTRQTYDALDAFLSKLYDFNEELGAELEFILVEGNITPEGSFGN